MGDLANRVVIVTGGAPGIGLGCCEVLAAESTERLVAKMTERFGRIDVPVNNLDQPAVLLSSANGRPGPAAVAGRRRRYDIERLTALRSGAN